MNPSTQVTQTAKPDSTADSRRASAKNQLRHPHPLLDGVLERMQLKNDAALARLLQVTPPRISKIRRGWLRVSPDMLLRLHEIGQIPLAELRELMAIPCQKLGGSETAETQGHKHGALS